MYRLTCFELDKVWRKRSFLLSVAVLLAINIFLLWYTNLPNNETPPIRLQGGRKRFAAPV